ncbi:MAG: response regulator [Anaerolineae bacterium]|nr:response regulator [Anaerolineae bacterium]
MLSERFVRQVRDALAHLYDVAHLQEHPLCEIFFGDSAMGVVDNARSLRKVLLETIEQLRPANRVPYNAREWRPYRVLYHRYVQRMSTLEIARELAISERQYQREHAKALRALAALLQDRFQKGIRLAEDTMGHEMISEVRRFIAGARRETLDGEELVRGTLRAIENLATEQHVQLSLEVKRSPISIYGDRSVLRQVILNVLSELIIQVGTCAIHIVLEGSKNQVNIRFHPSESLSSLQEILGSSHRLLLSSRFARAVGGHLDILEDAIVLTLPMERQLILVVDDNKDVLDMFERFLAGSSFRVLGAYSAQQALALAREHQPSLILLDVMMPGHDGWEALQALKHNPETRDIPVIICSILDEPDLAFSLGADDYIRKPVTSEDLFAVLARWHNGPLPSP